MHAWRRRTTALAALVILVMIVATVLIGPYALLLLLAAALIPILWKVAETSAADAIRLALRRPEPPTKLLRDVKRVHQRGPRELGVRRSTLAEEITGTNTPPYARFLVVDDALDAAFSDPRTRMVMIRGHAGAGKSRMLSEAIGRHFANSYLAIPDPAQRDSLTDLIGHAAWFRGGPDTVVVWLDRLEEYLEPGVLTSDVIEQGAAASPRFLFVGTIRSEPLDALHSSATKTPPMLDRDLLEKLLNPEPHSEIQSLEVSERTALDPGDPATRAYTGIDVSKGLGVALSQRDVYVDAYRSTSLDLFARALVQAAVDLRRVGLRGPFSEKQLTEVASYYPTSGERRGLAAAQNALAIANAPMGGREDIRLLIAVEQRWTVDDLLLDIDSGQAGVERREIPEEVWAITTGDLSTAEVAAMAISAEWQGASMVTVEELWRRVLASGDPDYAPQALYSLGVRFDEQGRYDEAIAIWEEAAESGHEEFAAQSLFNLGSLYHQRQEIDAAIDACRRAIATGHPHHAPRSMWNLGWILEQRGEIEPAMESYDEAAKTPHADAASKSAARLGTLRAERGEIEKAVDAFERVVELRQYGYEVPAMNQLAGIYEQTGETEKAHAWQQRAKETAGQMDYGFY
jgi:Tfp pilus assembly protein PilF